LKKYEFTDETKEVDGRILHRIMAVSDSMVAKRGDLGGFIETDYNLSQEDSAWVGGYACVYDRSCVIGSALVMGNAIVHDYVWVSGLAYVGGNAKVSGSSLVSDGAVVTDNAVIEGNARVVGHTILNKDAFVTRSTHFITIGAIGSRNGYTTFFRNKDNGISVNCGCFNGSIEEFLDRVNKFHGDDKHGKSYRIAVELAKNQIQLV